MQCQYPARPPGSAFPVQPDQTSDLRNYVYLSPFFILLSVLLIHLFIAAKTRARPERASRINYILGEADYLTGVFENLRVTEERLLTAITRSHFRGHDPEFNRNRPITQVSSLIQFGSDFLLSGLGRIISDLNHVESTAGVHIAD